MTNIVGSVQLENEISLSQILFQKKYIMIFPIFKLFVYKMKFIL